MVDGRAQFNEWAGRLGFPFVWARDDGNQRLDVAKGELAIFGEPVDHYIKDGRPTAALRQRLQLIDAAITGRAPKTLPAAQRTALQREMDSVEVVVNVQQLSATEHSAAERAMAREILMASQAIERNYWRQRDPAVPQWYEQVLAQGDPLALEVFVNNHGPWCERAVDRACQALPHVPKIVDGAQLYAAGMTQEHFNALSADLRSPWVAITGQPGAYRAVPFGTHPIFAEGNQRIARHLRAAAAYAKEEAATHSEPERVGWHAFIDYLEKIAEAHVADQPRPFDAADQAWVKIPLDFKWALRIGPDEVYWDKYLGQHAGYDSHFGLYDPKIQVAVRRLRAYGLQRMENEIAEIIGAEYYRPKTKSAELPMRFVRNLVVTGRARMPGAVVSGFTLPNEGPVVGLEKWIMVFESDALFQRSQRSMRAFVHEDQARALRSNTATTNTVTHEATHTLGPAPDDLAVLRIDADGTKHYRLDPQGNPIKCRDAIGGTLWSIVEETKASITALIFDPRLAKETVLGELRYTAAELQGQRAGVLDWAANQMVRGVFHPAGKISAYRAAGVLIYSQLAEQGAIQWNAQRGKWDVADPERFEAAGIALLRELGQIQATGDAARGWAFVQKYTGQGNPDAEPQPLSIAEREARIAPIVHYAEMRALATQHGIRPITMRWQVAID